MDGSRRRFVATLVVLFALLSATALPAAGTPAQAWGAQAVDPDQVYLQVDLQPDGDAAWSVTYRVRLETQNETEAFKELKQDIEQNESAFLDDFSRRITDTVEAAENATGRQMAATNFSVTAEITQIPQTYGIIRYTFTWQNFAVTRGDRIIAGDALAGFFLDSETTLAVQWPEAYELTRVVPEPDDVGSEKVVWQGPLDFGDGEPRVVVAKTPATTTTTTTTTTAGGPTETTSGPPGDDAGGIPTTIVGLALLLAVVAVAAFAYVRRDKWTGGGAASTTGEPGGPGGAGGAPTETDGETPGAGEEPSEAVPAGEEPPEELLSNEERVKRFLQERGGRAKQQELVEELGWTDAKTSQVLSGMESDDEIEKFRIGRENVVKLPDGDESLE